LKVRGNTNELRTYSLYDIGKRNRVDFKMEDFKKC